MEWTEPANREAAQKTSCWFRCLARLMMMQGIDASFAGAILLAITRAQPAWRVRAHTISSARLADVKLNNLSMSEAGINAAAIAESLNGPSS